MRATRLHAAALALAGTLAVTAPATATLTGGSLLASTAAGGTAKAKSGLAILITKRTVVPRVQRTIRFTGYATYMFSAPRGRRIVSASARIVGAQAHAVKVLARAISRHATRYTVKLVFPGEQGNPGRLVVVLGTVALSPQARPTLSCSSHAAWSFASWPSACPYRPSS
jgi:hypothetical protein